MALATPIPCGPRAAPAAAEPDWHWLPWTGAEPAEARVRAWLAPRLGTTPAALPLWRDAHGRPRLGAPHAGEDVGWSHSGAGLLVAHARGAIVGIDLEHERPRRRPAELAARFFHPDEAAWLARQPAGAARDAAFLRLWCAKEAVLKAHGRGLAFGLHRLAFASHAGTLRLVACDPGLGDPAQWTLRELRPRPGYRGALAWRRGASAGEANA